MLKMKILIIANNDGGLYLFRKELLETLSRHYEVFVSAPNEDGDIGKLQALGCRCIVTDIKRRSINPLSDLKLFQTYRKLIRSIRPDVVLTYTIKPNVYGGIACQTTGTPYMTNITGLGTSIENGGLLALISTTLYKIGLRKAECVFFQNEASRALFTKKGIVKGRTRLVPGSGVNLEEHCTEPYPDETKGILFLFVGRVMKDKGVGELVEAFKRIHQKYPTVMVDIVGPQEEDYSADFETAGAAVHYLGPQTDMHSFYKNCHCAVLPSYHEGTANVMLEASATARPVITTRVPGCAKTFDEGVTGFGCEAKDTDSLIAAIEKFLKLSTEERVQMGLNARTKMEREYDRQLVIDAYLDEIEQIEKRSRQ